MADSFINLLNVLEAATFLSTADRYAIKPQILEDAEDFILALKTALDNFNNPAKDKAHQGYSPIMLFDVHLSVLLNATKNLYDILTEDGKDAVKKYLDNKKEERIDE